MPRDVIGSGELRLIHWPNANKGPMWLVEVSPRDGSYFPLVQLGVKTVAAAVERLQSLSVTKPSCPYQGPKSA